MLNVNTVMNTYTFGHENYPQKLHFFTIMHHIREIFSLVKKLMVGWGSNQKDAVC